MKPLKILIEMKHGLGDCVCMLPAIRAVREKFPDAYIAMLVEGKANEEIFRHSRIKIDQYYHFSLKKYSVWHTAKVLTRLFFTGFDVGILAFITPVEKGKKFFKLLRIKQCYGEQFEGLSLYDRDKIMHFVDRNLDVVRSLVGDAAERQPYLFADPDEGEKFAAIIDRLCGKIIAVNIGGANKNFYKGDYVFTRNWNKESMHELVGKLADLPQCYILLLGGRLEEELVKDYEDIIARDNVFNFVNRTTIGESIFLLSRSDISVGVDTGMQHVADALGKPTVSVFGPTDPKTHGAYSDKAEFVQCMPKLACQYCFERDVYYTCPNRKCLNQISADDVLEKVVKVLEKY